MRKKMVLLSSLRAHWREMTCRGLRLFLCFHFLSGIPDFAEHRRNDNLKESRQIQDYATHFFFFASSLMSAFFVTDVIFPNMTTPFPSMKATRERPSQFLKVSQTRGCWGAMVISAISFDFRLWGSSIFFPPVSLPIFHFSFTIRQADRPHRTKPMGE